MELSKKAEKLLQKAIDTRDIDLTVFALNNCNRQKIRVPRINIKDIKVGDIYWYFDTGYTNTGGTWRKLKITYIRSEMVFYEYIYPKRMKEDSFPLHCLMSHQLYPVEFIGTDNPKYYEYVSSSPVKIKYNYNK